MYTLWCSAEIGFVLTRSHWLHVKRQQRVYSRCLEVIWSDREHPQRWRTFLGTSSTLKWFQDFDLFIWNGFNPNILIGSILSIARLISRCITVKYDPQKTRLVINDKATRCQKFQIKIRCTEEGLVWWSSSSKKRKNNWRIGYESKNIPFCGVIITN